MKPKPSARRILWFGLKFCVILLVLAPLWWWISPCYGWLLVQGCGSFLKFILGMPILAGRVEAQGILNTGSELIFTLDGHEPRMKLAGLVTNLPPFLALVMATPGLARRRKAGALLAGSAILIGVHALFIVVAMRFGAQMQASEIPAAVLQFLLTLPFLLWIVLAWWPQAPAGTARDSSDSPPAVAARRGP